MADYILDPVPLAFALPQECCTTPSYRRFPPHWCQFLYSFICSLSGSRDGAYMSAFITIFNSLSFAIERTYAIPSISRVLSGTGELRSGPTVSKRYLDTAIIVGTWGICPVSTKEPPSEFYAEHVGSQVASTDPRTYIAIARMNWIHSHYKIPKTLKQSNDDYLYTLALFVLEPRWTRRYGWRPLSQLEIHARYVFYRHVGEMMNIYDIPGSIAELETWADDYEMRCMAPTNTNHELAEGMLEELVSSVPSVFRGLLKRIAICVMDERMKKAMKLPAQPRVLHALVSIGAALMRLFGRHLLLPRTHAKCVVPIEYPAPPLDGRLVRTHPILMFSKVTKPWYAPRTAGISRVLEKIALAVGLISADGIPGPQYNDEGYRLEELGPHRWKNGTCQSFSSAFSSLTYGRVAGHAEVMKQASEMMGCPVQSVWARDVAGGIA
ncbi:hypothetical protein PENSPDRAFT_730649 [Peniophora sp. CONT]|nr:hypothetical protein PENSPDRAFT_730649 [Peniophora sp. CONT]